jgi:sRNA-binding carbon storage regulator CsrA
MLILKRKEGQWVEIAHRSGDIMRVKIYDIKEGAPPTARMAFEDGDRNFDVCRSERLVTQPNR